MPNLLGQSEKLHHGGRLRAAATHYNLPLQDWLDLSTGINSNGWQVEAIPASVWRRLPEEEDELLEAACNYYGAPSLLPVAGSQAAIQALPHLRRSCRVCILNPGYAEHAHAWRRANHQVSTVASDQINDALPYIDILIIIHPNNPTGTIFSTGQLLDWRAQLADRGGWLIVDEAFMDVTPEQSIASYTTLPGLVVLRSLGKFFGLAGARVGFVCAHAALLTQLDAILGPWTVSTASRWIAAQALQNHGWHKTARLQLIHDSKRLQSLLTQHNLAPDGGCALFQWMRTPYASAIHEKLAQQGILTRLFNTPLSLRFGLPGTESDWYRLNKALAKIAGSN